MKTSSIAFGMVALLLFAGPVAAIKYSNPANAFYGSWPYFAIMSPANPPVYNAAQTRWEFKIDIYDQEGTFVRTRNVNLRDTETMYDLDEKIRREMYVQFESDTVSRAEAVNYLYSFYNNLPMVAACIQR